MRMQIVSRVTAVVALAALAVLLASASTAQAQEGTPKPFIFPFAGPPGPNSWLFGQPYGNTTFAYRSRLGDYRMGQGLHFGIDISAKCGTPVLAVGDGVVADVDNVYGYGSGPHNIMINHPNGYASLYGHLLQRPTLAPGTQVKQGQVVGLSGDPDATCYSRPHLHLEIRDASHRHAYNPLNFIDMDWDAISLYNAFARAWQRNLDDPREWTDPLDQPDTTFGGGLLNDFARPWPP